MLTKVIAKIVQVVFLPEAEIATPLASFAVWAAQMIIAGLAIATACN